MSPRFLSTTALAGCVALMLAGCGADSPGGSSSTSVAAIPSPSATTTPDASPQSATWSYGGSDGPERWADTSPTCASTSTSQQSPIDIDKATLTTSDDAAPVEIDLHAAAFSVFNNGHTIEAVPQKEGSAGGFTIDDTTYELAQFHFHDPSEHTIDGKHAPMELHMVAKSTDGDTAVLGLLLDVATENAPLAELFDSMPADVTEETQAVHLSTPIDLSTIVPADAPLARYSGSLTTPPCTEGILWDVYLSDATVSAEQLAAFQRLYPDNHRPTQDLNGRSIGEVTETLAGG